MPLNMNLNQNTKFSASGTWKNVRFVWSSMFDPIKRSPFGQENSTFHNVTQTTCWLLLRLRPYQRLMAARNWVLLIRTFDKASLITSYS